MVIYIEDLFSAFFGGISEVTRKSFNKTPKLIKVHNIVAKYKTEISQGSVAFIDF